MPHPGTGLPLAAQARSAAADADTALDRAESPADARQQRLNLWAARALGVVMFAMLPSIGARIAVPLPPDGVPMTLQDLAVILCALCIGPRLGLVSMGLYLLVGALGAGVFSEGRGGLAVILGQTGGYLVGFALCQPVMAPILKRRDGSIRGWGAIVLAVLAAHAVIFAVGVPWLAIVNGFTPWRAVQGGLLPFLPGMLIKAGLAVLIARWAVPFASRRIW